MNITVVGHVCIDRNSSESGTFLGAGSPAMFMHKIFSQLPDCILTIVGPYGDDFLPYKGSVSLYPKYPLAIQTLVYENTMNGAKRTQRCFHHAEALPVQITDDILSGADCICIAPLTSAYTANYIAELLSHKKMGASVFLLPQGYFRKFDTDGTVNVREFSEAQDILPLVDTVIVSDQDHADMHSIATSWASNYSCSVIVTMAEKGAIVYSGSHQTIIETTPVPQNEIISSIGAGDIFSAAVMYEFSKSRNISEAISFGHKIAGQCLRMAPDAIVLNVR